MHRIRPVTEDNEGRSQITAEKWPEDRDTIFPLQAAAGYAMIRGLFQNRKNVLVEGMTDYYYLQELSHQCAKSGLTHLPEDIYIIPCGGTKNVGIIASLFMSEQVRPLVLLDGDESGRARKNSLIEKLYIGHDSNVLILDDILHRTGQDVEIEDLIGEQLILEGLTNVIGNDLSIDQADASDYSLPKRIKLAAHRCEIDLPVGWKISVALNVVTRLSKNQSLLSDNTLEDADKLFKIIRNRFDKDSSR